MKKVFTLKEVRDRESDPGLHERAKSNAGKAHELLKGVDLSGMARRALQETTPRRRLAKIRETIGVVANALSTTAACKRGCSSCCHIPVALTQTEADIIGDAIGREAATPKYSTEVDYSATGTACTFLVNDECSIYENRPLACRLCFNMDEDETLCQLFEGEAIDVPYYDGRQFELLFVESLGARDGLAMSTLNKFFPKESA